MQLGIFANRLFGFHLLSIADNFYRSGTEEEYKQKEMYLNDVSALEKDFSERRRRVSVPDGKKEQAAKARDAALARLPQASGMNLCTSLLRFSDEHTWLWQCRKAQGAKGRR